MRVFGDGQRLDRLLNRLPLPVWMTHRFRRLLKDEDKMSWQKQLLRGFIKYSFLLKVLFWMVMLVHLLLKYVLRFDATTLGDEAKLDPGTVSIVVVTRNQPESLSACLKSLAEADYGNDQVRIPRMYLFGDDIFV